MKVRAAAFNTQFGMPIMAQREGRNEQLVVNLILRKERPTT